MTGKSNLTLKMLLKLLDEKKISKEVFIDICREISEASAPFEAPSKYQHTIWPILPETPSHPNWFPPRDTTRYWLDNEDTRLVQRWVAPQVVSLMNSTQAVH